LLILLDSDSRFPQTE